MANHYLQFSEALVRLMVEERDWLRQQLEIVHVFGQHEYLEGTVPKHLEGVAPTRIGCRAFRTLNGAELDEEIGFQYQFLEDDEHGHYLWLYTEENGEPYRVAHLVQMFLRQFRLHECWSLTYATNCSKPRLGEFAGGAMFVTPAGIQACDAYDFVGQQHTVFTAANTTLSERTPA